MAWQAIGHGADEIGYWQWRSALNGQEEYHGTLVGPDGTPVPLYEEVSQIGREFEKVASYLAGTQPVSQVALLHDYDSHWAIDLQRHTEKYDQVELLRSYYHVLQKRAQSVDVVNPYADLTHYKLVVAPDLNLIPEDLARHLLDYVQNGGHLVLGPRSGMKDQFNALLPQRQPGFLVDALGGRVEQYYALDKDFPVSGVWGSGEAKIWAEQLRPSAANSEVLMKYGKSNGWLDDQPAVITRPFGKGRITHIGVILDDKLMSVAADWMVRDIGVIAAFGPVPDGVEVCRRSTGGKRVFVLINFAPEKRSVKLPHPMKFLLSDGRGDTLELPQYGVEVLADSL